MVQSQSQSLSPVVDVPLLNGIANHPSMRPWLGSTSEVLDLAPVIENPRNVALQNCHGGFVAIWADTGVYDVNVLPAPSAEGDEVLHLAQHGLRHLFSRTECTEAICTVPTASASGLLLARTAGFAESFRRPQSWMLSNGRLCDTVHFSMTLPRWISRDPELSDDGRTFRSQLERLVAQPHRADETADRFMGALALMVRSDNAKKGALVYARLASIACGYPPIYLVTADPPVIDAAGALFQVNRDGLELLSRGTMEGASDG